MTFALLGLGQTGLPAVNFWVWFIEQRMSVKIVGLKKKFYLTFLAQIWL